jgi:hypothetical protein
MASFLVGGGPVWSCYPITTPTELAESRAPGEPFAAPDALLPGRRKRGWTVIVGDHADPVALQDDRALYRAHPVERFRRPLTDPITQGDILHPRIHIVDFRRLSDQGQRQGATEFLLLIREGSAVVTTPVGDPAGDGLAEPRRKGNLVQRLSTE